MGVYETVSSIDQIILEWTYEASPPDVKLRGSTAGKTSLPSKSRVGFISRPHRACAIKTQIA